MLAGLGTAGLLVGAVAAVAALTAGVVAFDRWPGSPGATERSAIPLGGTQNGATARLVRAANAAIEATASSVKTASASAGRAAARSVGAGVSGANGNATTSTRGSGSAGRPASATTTTASSGTSTVTSKPAGVSGVSEVANRTGTQVAGAVKDGGAALADAARPVNGDAATAVATLSIKVSDAVTAATNAISRLLSGISAPPPS